MGPHAGALTTFWDVRSASGQLFGGPTANSSMQPWGVMLNFIGACMELGNLLKIQEF